MERNSLPTHSSFGRILRGFRERIRVEGNQPLSRSRLGARAGLDPSYISRLESGERSPGLGAVVKLSEVLELSGIERDCFYIAAGTITPELQEILLDKPVLLNLVWDLNHVSKEDLVSVRDFMSDLVSLYRT